VICTNCHEEDGVEMPIPPPVKYRRNRSKAWNAERAHARNRLLIGMATNWRCNDCPMPDEETANPLLNNQESVK
jgi:hypothetical protein